MRHPQPEPADTAADIGAADTPVAGIAAVDRLAADIAVVDKSAAGIAAVAEFELLWLPRTSDMSTQSHPVFLRSFCKT